MIPQIDELVNFGIYREINYNEEYEANQDSMTFKNSNNTIRKAERNGLTSNRQKLFITEKQTLYLRKIAFMITVLAVLTIMGTCCWVYMFFKIKFMI